MLILFMIMSQPFTSKLEIVQYKVCLAMASIIEGISRELLNKKLDLESLCDRRWVCMLTFLYKIGNSPQYRSDYLKRINSVYNAGSVNQTFFHLAFLSGTN